MAFKAVRRCLPDLGGHRWCKNFFAETSASGAASVGVPFTEGRGKLVQGSLESSNVNVVQQLVEMIETQRAYEVSSKSITAADEMMRYISNNL